MNKSNDLEATICGQHSKKKKELSFATTTTTRAQHTQKPNKIKERNNSKIMAVFFSSFFLPEFKDLVKRMLEKRVCGFWF